MEIPEPSAHDLGYDLEVVYERNMECPHSRAATLEAVIRRCAAAEKERDELRVGIQDAAKVIGGKREQEKMLSSLLRESGKKLERMGEESLVGERDLFEGR